MLGCHRLAERYSKFIIPLYFDALEKYLGQPNQEPEEEETGALFSHFRFFVFFVIFLSMR